MVFNFHLWVLLVHRWHHLPLFSDLDDSSISFAPQQLLSNLPGLIRSAACPHLGWQTCSKRIVFSLEMFRRDGCFSMGPSFHRVFTRRDFFLAVVNNIPLLDHLYLHSSVPSGCFSNGYITFFPIRMIRFDVLGCQSCGRFSVWIGAAGYYVHSRQSVLRETI